MSAVAVAVVGGAVIGAVGSSYAASKSAKASQHAANTQAGAAAQATQAQLEMYYQGREDLEPWREEGQKALGQLVSEIETGPGKYKESPYYNFLMDEGVKAIDRSASARGMMDSGATGKELTRFGQNLASTDYQNWINNWLTTKVNPLQSLANVGQTTSSQNASNAMTTGANIGNNAIRAGDAIAGGAINSANAFAGGMQGVTNAANQGLNNWLFYNSLNQSGTPQTNYIGAGTYGVNPGDANWH